MSEVRERRKPRIALMGEFSAGKSTLSNLLLGERPLPESVTATNLSPVWISSGPREAYRECLDGTTEPVHLDDLHSVPLDNTRVIRLSLEAALLDTCDLIDCPGISDPNMPSEVWERLIPEIDAVLWCTHATQAWRQSEAAVWEGIPERVKARSLLLITRFDKLTNARDRDRVIARVRRETDGLFDGIYPIALLQALAAGENSHAWEASGALGFTQRLTSLIDEVAATTPRLEDMVAEAAAALVVDPEPAPVEDEAPTRRRSLFDLETSPPAHPSVDPILDGLDLEDPGPSPRAAMPVRPMTLSRKKPVPLEMEEPAAVAAEPKSAPLARRTIPLDTPEAPPLRRAPSTEEAAPALRRTAPRPTAEEEAPLSPRPTASAPVDEAPPPARSTILPRRVGKPLGQKTERPVRKRPVAKSMDTGLSSREPSLNDLRSAFSQD